MDSVDKDPGYGDPGYGRVDPGYGRVRDFLLYGLSLPERAVRSASGALGGALRESASLLVPQAFRNSKTYNVMIQQMLDFMAEEIGGVERPADPNAPPKVEQYVARKAVGNFVDLAGLATFHLSPLLILAVVSDVAYGSQAYLREVADDLKQQGVIDRNSTIDHADDLLKAVAGAARNTAAAFDTPPLSAQGLKDTIDQARQAAKSLDPTKLLPQAEVLRLWNEIHQTATSQGVDPLAISGAMTLYALDKIGKLGRGILSTVEAAGSLLDRHVLEHYTQALGEIRRKGMYAVLSETSRPYIDAVWRNFSARKTTLTEGLFSGRLIAKAWKEAWGWLSGRRHAKPEGGEGGGSSLPP
jgi:hypothetical protein